MYNPSSALTSASGNFLKKPEEIPQLREMQLIEIQPNL
jgi:hypothetical protein